ncbi:MAG: hypothetical protein Q4D81_02795, partial [Eubacteriales bacterium]|nr:hypothetical protein [Eubacteriales bacterium]
MAANYDPTKPYILCNCGECTNDLNAKKCRMGHDLVKTGQLIDPKTTARFDPTKPYIRCDCGDCTNDFDAKKCRNGHDLAKTGHVVDPREKGSQPWKVIACICIAALLITVIGNLVINVITDKPDKPVTESVTQDNGQDNAESGTDAIAGNNPIDPVNTPATGEQTDTNSETENGSIIIPDLVLKTAIKDKLGIGDREIT